MGSKRLDKISDYARNGYRVRIDCLACKRTVIDDPLRLATLCHERSWSMQVESVAARLKCSGCGSRNVRLRPGFGG